MQNATEKCQKMLTHSFRRPIMDLLGKTKNYVFGVKSLP